MGQRSRWESSVTARLGRKIGIADAGIYIRRCFEERLDRSDVQRQFRIDFDLSMSDSFLDLLLKEEERRNGPYMRRRPTLEAKQVTREQVQADLDRRQRDAEAFINEPLEVFIQRLMGSGVAWAEIERQVGKRSGPGVRFTLGELKEIARREPPDTWERPSMPTQERISPYVGSNPRVGGWGMPGGLPTLGKRK